MPRVWQTSDFNPAPGSKLACGAPAHRLYGAVDLLQRLRALRVTIQESSCETLLECIEMLIREVFTVRTLTRVVLLGVVVGIMAGSFASVFELPLRLVLPIAIALLVGLLTPSLIGQSKSRHE